MIWLEAEEDYVHELKTEIAKELEPAILPREKAGAVFLQKLRQYRKEGYRKGRNNLFGRNRHRKNRGFNNPDSFT